MQRINQRFHAWYNPYAIEGDFLCVPFHPIAEVVKKQETTHEVHFRVRFPHNRNVQQYTSLYPEKGISVVTLQNPDISTWDKEDGVPRTITLEIPVVEKSKVQEFISTSYSGWVVVGVSYPDPDFEDEF